MYLATSEEALAKIVARTIIHDGLENSMNGTTRANLYEIICDLTNEDPDALEYASDAEFCDLVVEALWSHTEEVLDVYSDEDDDGYAIELHLDETKCGLVDDDEEGEDEE